MSHLKLQKDLSQLGSNIGFNAYMEYQIERLYPAYSPLIDVAWFYPLSTSQSQAVSKVYDLWPFWEGNRALYPYAAFEITATDATSKTVLSEIWNMRTLGFRYSFKVVPDKLPNYPDHMHKERAERIGRMIKVFSGISDILVVSLDEMQRGIKAIDFVESNEEKGMSNTSKDIDKLADDIAEYLVKLGRSSGFTVVREYTPLWLKEMEEEVTHIRYDAAWLLYLPTNIEQSFKSFIKAVGIEKTVKSLSPLEILSFEVERKQFNKHSIGSVLNIASITGRGTVFVKKRTEELVKTVRLISSNKVDLKSVEHLAL